MGAGRNPAALGLLFTWTRGTPGILMFLGLDPVVARTDPLPDPVFHKRTSTEIMVANHIFNTKISCLQLILSS